MSKPAFAMSMFASKADLYEAKANYFENELKKLREDVLDDRNMAANPGPYLQESDYDYASGKEFALDEVVDSLNRILGE